MEEGAIIKHNIKNAPKTGDWRFMHPQINEDKCTGCTTCNQYCPEACMFMEEKVDANLWGNEEGAEEKKKKIKKIAKIDYDYCKGCGVCAEVCPVKAIVMKK